MGASVAGMADAAGITEEGVTWLVLSPLPYVLLAAAMLGLVYWSHHRGYVDGTDDTWDVVTGLIPDLPATLEEFLAQAEAHPFHLDAEHDLFDEPERACRVCGCTQYEACPGGCEWVADPAGIGHLCSNPRCVEVARRQYAAMEDGRRGIELARDQVGVRR